jgi:hypothetical protein
MEFTPTQLSIINLILPFKYRIEPSSKTESKSNKPIQRKSEAENLRIDSRFPPKVPEKRPAENPLKQEPSVNPKSRSSEGYKKLLNIINELKKHEKMRFFQSSVDKKHYPDFFDSIKDSIDLALVESRLNSGYYKDSYQFALDVRKIWKNSFSYFLKENIEIYQAAVDLSIEFERLMEGNENLQITEKKTQPDVGGTNDKPVKVVKEEKSVLNNKPLGYMEKKELCEKIQKLDPKHLKGVLEIVKECTDMNGEELEFDLDNLPPRTCRRLDEYVKSCFSNTKVPKREEEKKVKEKIPEPPVQKVEEKKSEVYLPEDSESESSSTSESKEDEIPNSSYPSGFHGLEDEFTFGSDVARW